MPLQELSPEQRAYLKSIGKNPDDYGFDSSVAQQSQQPSGNSGALGAGVRSAAASALPTAAGGLAYGAVAPAATGALAAMLGGAVAGGEAGAVGGPVGVPIGATIGGLGAGLIAAFGASALTAKAQQAAMPEAWQQQLADDAKNHPIASEVGSIATLPLGGFSPSTDALKGAMWAGNKLIGRAAGEVGSVGSANLGKQAFVNTIAGAGIGAAQEAGTELMDGQDLSVGRILGQAGVGAAFNRPNMFGSAYNSVYAKLGMKPGFHFDDSVPGSTKADFDSSGQGQAVPPAGDKSARQLLGAAIPPADNPLANAGIPGNWVTGQRGSQRYVPLKPAPESALNMQSMLDANIPAEVRPLITRLKNQMLEGGERGSQAEKQLQELYASLDATAPVEHGKDSDFNRKILTYKQLPLVGMNLQRAMNQNQVPRSNAVKEYPLSQQLDKGTPVEGRGAEDESDLAARNIEQSAAGEDRMRYNAGDEGMAAGDLSRYTMDEIQQAQQDLEREGLSGNVTARMLAKRIAANKTMGYNTEVNNRLGAGNKGEMNPVDRVITYNTGDKDGKGAASVDTLPHEPVHAVLAAFPDHLRAKMLDAAKPMLEAENAKRAEWNKQHPDKPVKMIRDPEEWLALATGAKSVSRAVAGGNEGLGNYWKDTKAFWKFILGKSNITDMQRVLMMKIIDSDAPLKLSAGAGGDKKMEAGEGVEQPSKDKQEYDKLASVMKAAKPGSPEYMEAWKQLEVVKNRNGGMPPKHQDENEGIPATRQEENYQRYLAEKEWFGRVKPKMESGVLDAKNPADDIHAKQLFQQMKDALGIKHQGDEEGLQADPEQAKREAAYQEKKKQDAERKRAMRATQSGKWQENSKKEALAEENTNTRKQLFKEQLNKQFGYDEPSQMMTDDELKDKLNKWIEQHPDDVARWKESKDSKHEPTSQDILSDMEQDLMPMLRAKLSHDSYFSDKMPSKDRKDWHPDVKDVFADAKTQLIDNGLITDLGTRREDPDPTVKPVAINPEKRRLAYGAIDRAIRNVKRSVVTGKEMMSLDMPIERHGYTGNEGDVTHPSSVEDAENELPAEEQHDPDTVAVITARERTAAALHRSSVPEQQKVIIRKMHDELMTMQPHDDVNMAQLLYKHTNMKPDTKLEEPKIPASVKHQDSDEGIRDIFTTKAQKILHAPPAGLVNKEGSVNGSQLLGALRNQLSPTEYSVLKDAGIENAFNGKFAKLADVQKWVADNVPKVEVKKFGEGAANTPEQKEYNQLRHSLWDSLSESQRVVVRRAQESGKTITKYDAALFGHPLTEKFINDVNRFNHLDTIAQEKGWNKSSNQSHWGGIVAPKSEKDMPGYVEIAVVKPTKGGVTNSKLAPEYHDYQFPSSHHFPPNTLGFVRGYMESGANLKKYNPGKYQDVADNDKVFLIIEAQYDQKPVQDDRTKLWSVSNTPALSGKIFKTREEAQAALVAYEPLMAHAERLALKAAIEHARSEGATKIAISDAETAMMSERHDRVTTYKKKYNSKEEAMAEGEKLRNGLLDYLGSDKGLTSGEIKVNKDNEVVISSPLIKNDIQALRKLDYVLEHENGMRLHYDRTLPKIAEELTGSKGERVEMGTHNKAMQDKRGVGSEYGGDIEEPRKDLIFRNPDGTPKTDVTGRMYSLDKVSQRLDSGDKFTLFNKHQSVEEGLRSQANFMMMKPSLDVARDKAGTKGKPVADAIQDFHPLKAKYVADFSQRTLGQAAKMSRMDVDKVHGTLQREMQDKPRSAGQQDGYRGQLQNDKQRALYDAARADLRAKQQTAIDKGFTVTDNGRQRAARIDPDYYPGVLSQKTLQTIGERGEGYGQVKKDFLNYWQQHGYSPEEAGKRWESMLSIASPREANRLRFAGARLAEGVGVPPKYAEPSLTKTFSKYANRVATDFAWREKIEQNPEVSKLLDKKNDEGVYPQFEKVVNRIQGEPFDKDSRLIKALNRVATSMMLGPTTNIHIGWSSMFNPMQYLKASEVGGAYTRAVSHLADSWHNALKSGYAQHDMNSVRTLGKEAMDSSESAITRLNDVAGIIGRLNGRALTDRCAKTFAQAISEEIVPLRMASAVKGDKGAIKLMKQLDSQWSPDKSYAPEQKAGLASTLAGFIHGAHDARTLPNALTEDTVIQPFLSLMSWSTAQTNQWMKHVWEPATRGNVEPLLMSCLGAAVGGYAIQQLRQMITDKKSNIPSLTEIAASSKGLSGNVPLLAYNFMQMASFTGVAGLGSVGAKYVFDAAYKNIPQGSAFPLDELIDGSAETITEAVSAWLQTPNSEAFLNIFPQMMIDLGKGNVQAARIASNWAADKGMSTENENYKFELSKQESNLRRYKMAEGQPYEQQMEPNANPYLNMPTKQFKRTGDIQQAASEVPSLINRAMERAGGNPEIFKQQLEALKQNSYQSMPSLEHTPLQFSRYYNYLVASQGKEAADRIMQSYMQHNVVNKVKSSLIP